MITTPSQPSIVRLYDLGNAVGLHAAHYLPRL